MEDLGFHGKNKISIIRGLCQYYRILWCQGKKIHSIDRIHSFYIAAESLETMVHENNSRLATTHFIDFEYYFPELCLLPL